MSWYNWSAAGRRVGGGPAGSVERLLVDPHEGPRLVGFALVLDAAELVSELAVLPLVVVVVLCLPDRLERSCLVKLDKRETRCHRHGGTENE